MVPPCSDRISRVPPYSRTIVRLTRTGLSPTTARLSRRFRFSYYCHWPGPRSLAATNGVSVDVLSYGYLDVSVPHVRFIHPILFRCRYLITISRKIRCSKEHLKFSRHLRWVSPFGYPRIKAYSQLPMAFRSVSRPSSPVHPKASTKCP